MQTYYRVRLSTAATFVLLAVSSAIGQQQIPQYTLKTAPLVDVTPTPRTPPPDVKLGRGYNTLTGNIRGDAVVDTEQTAKPPNGQDAVFNLVQITSYAELRDYLGYSAAASFDGFGAGGSFSFSYMKEVQMHRYSNFLLVTVVVTNSATSLSEYVLQKEVIKYAKKPGANFLVRYGNSFISSMTTGGRFVAIVEFLADSEAEQEAISADLKVHAGPISSSGDFQSAMSSLQQNWTTKIKIIREGGVGSLPTGTTLIQAALDFPKEVDPQQGGHPIVFAFDVKDYPVTSNWPGAIPSNLRKQQEDVEQLAKDRDECLTLQTDIQYIEDSPFQFGNPDKTVLDGKIKLLDSDIKVLADAANGILEKPLDPYTIPSTDLSKILPLPDRINGYTPPLKVQVQLFQVGLLTYPANTWAGLSQSELDDFSVQLDTPVRGLSIHYQARFICFFARPGEECYGHPFFRDAADGTLMSPPKYGLNRWVNAFRIWLGGPMAPYYDINYSGRFIKAGEQMVATNGNWVTIGGWGNDWLNQPVSAIKVWVVAKQH
jgi:hypothetical protein